MNNQTKILLNIQGISGRTLRLVETQKVKKSKKKSKNKSKENNTQSTYSLEQIPCQQTIKMSYDAYEYFTSVESPFWYKGSWKKLNKKQRLEEHLKRTCEDRGGTSFTYNVLDD